MKKILFIIGLACLCLVAGAQCKNKKSPAFKADGTFKVMQFTDSTWRKPRRCTTG